MVIIPITHTSDNGAESPADYSGVPANLRFNSGVMSKSFTFTATNDMIDDDGESVRLGFGTLPPRVTAGATATVSIDDDDGAGVTVSVAGLTIDEGGSGTYTIKLDSQPTANVTVTINDPSVNTDVTAEPASLIFSSSDWSTAQTVTVNVAQDEDTMDETATVTHSVTSTDSSYSGASANNVDVSITDNDHPLVTVSFSPTTYTVAEGESVIVTVTLSAVPKRMVDIPITHMPKDGAIPDDYSGVPTNLIFSATETSKTITFEATQDMIDDDGESVLLGFGTLPLRVSAGATTEATVSITDDDDPQVTVSFDQDTFTVAEGDMQSVTVRLSEDPERTLNIPLTHTSDNGAESPADYSGVPANLTFNPGETEQTFTFTATNDADDDDDESVLLGFGGLPIGVRAGATDRTTISITDNDHPLVTVSFDRGEYTVPEGDTLTVTVWLSADPERMVIIPITHMPKDGAIPDDYSGVPTNLIFSETETSKNDHVQGDG